MPNRVRECRLSAGLTQQELAHRAGISIRTLTRVEDGEDTKISTLVAIADELGLSLGDLIAERQAS